MDPEGKWIILILYLVIFPIFTYIIIKYHSKKNSDWLVGKNMNLQKNKVIYLLSWFCIIFPVIILFQYFFPTEIINLFIEKYLLSFSVIIVILIPILFIYLGIKSIREKQSIFYTGYLAGFHQGLNPKIIKGLLGVIIGIFYFCIGLILLSGIASLVDNIFMCNSDKYIFFCPFIKILEIPLLPFKLINKWTIDIIRSS